MRNFHNGEDRFEFDSESDDGDENGNYVPEVEISFQNDLIEAMELDLTEIYLNQQLLDRAITIAKQDFLWWFRSPSVKTRRIEKIYNRLSKLVELKEDEKE